MAGFLRFVMLVVAMLVVTAAAACGESDLKQEADDPAQEAVDESQQDSDGDGVYDLYDDDPNEAKPEEPAKPEIAHVGDSITLEAGPDKVKVKLVKVTDPIEPHVDPVLGEAFDAPDAGNRFLGVTLRVSNVGTKPFDPSFAGTGSLVMNGDRPAGDAIITDTAPWSDYSSAKVAPGATLELYFPYQAPLNAKPNRFQYTISGATLDESTGEWRL